MGKIGASEWFSVTTGACEGVQVVVVRGDVDVVTAPAVDEAVESCQDLPVVVDLGGVEFISSAGIHVLLRKRPWPLALACPPGNVARVLEIVRAGRRVPVFDDLDSAVRSLTLRRSA